VVIIATRGRRGRHSQYLRTVAFRSRRRPAACKRRFILAGVFAREIVERNELAETAKTLGKSALNECCRFHRFDALGNALATTRHRATVAACGWAGGTDLPISAAPFILRGASLSASSRPYLRCGSGSGMGTSSGQA